MNKSRALSVENTADPAENELQDQLALFLNEVGERVLATRRQQKMSRRVLSEQSGVSQRTIVLLETGAGNISISLLYRVAVALGRPVEWFLQTGLSEQQDSVKVLEYFQKASSYEQQQVLNLLGAEDHKTLKRQRICLIGLRGAGKSTLGAALSDSLATPFVETNTEIESLSGLSVQELINLYGQEGYRRLEKQALDKIVTEYDSVVLAAAGGVVSDPDTYAYLLKYFHTVWLRAEPHEHMQRVREQGDERPMAGNPEAMQELKSILTSRESMYGAADLVLDTSNKSVKACSEELLSMVKLSVRSV